jgi:Ca2+-binding EF-hand superfamily protein
MFAPVGKKKLLLRIQRAGGTLADLEAQPGGKEYIAEMMKPSPGQTMLAAGGSVTSDGSPTPSQRKVGVNDDKQASLFENGGGAAYSIKQLKAFLSTPGARGQAFEKLMECASRYRPERDSISIKAFHSTLMTHELFRTRLAEAFFLHYSDEEYEHIKQCFDPDKNEVIDGYAFIVSFLKLAGIRKDQIAMQLKKKQLKFEEDQRAKVEREQLIKNKIFDEGVDFDYGYHHSRSAAAKMKAAAAKYDPGHPSAPDLGGFTVKSLKPYDFKGLLRRTFGVRLSPPELGAVIDEYTGNGPGFGDEKSGKREGDGDNASVETGGGSKKEGKAGGGAEVLAVPLSTSNGSKKKTNEIVCSEFLGRFLRDGHKEREAFKQEALKKQRKEDEERAEMELLKKEEDDKKMVMTIDFEYSEIDEATAEEKLLAAAEKYDKNHPSSLGLHGFEPKTSEGGVFKELVRRVFGLKFKPKELGFIVTRFAHDELPGEVDNQKFLIHFFQLGNDARHEKAMLNLHKQRAENDAREKEHLAKLKENETRGELVVPEDFTEENMQSAREKLVHASAKYFKGAPGSIGLQAFDAKYLLPAQFREVLKLTFGLKTSLPELAALLAIYDPDKRGHVMCQDFLVHFLKLGQDHRFEIASEQLVKQRRMDAEAADEAEKKLAAVAEKSSFIVDYEYTDLHLQSALEKMRVAAAKYNKQAPGAMSLDGFQSKFMRAGLFQEMLRRTFNLKVQGKELGAFYAHWTKDHPKKGVNCAEFTRNFCLLGIAERDKIHRAGIEKQRMENEEREKVAARLAAEKAAKLEYQLADASESDLDTSLAKLLEAAVSFDKTHPGSPSLAAFEVARMDCGLFSANLARCFKLRLTPNEVAALFKNFQEPPLADGTLFVNPSKFLVTFTRMGFEERGLRHKAQLLMQREQNKQREVEEQAKLEELWNKAEMKVDWSYTPVDLNEASELIAAAAKKYDPHGVGVPNLSAFDVHTMKPGVFKEMLKRAFNINLNPKQLAATVKQFDPEDKGVAQTKDFLNYFRQLGTELRQAEKAKHMVQQQKDEERRERNRARKKKLQDSKLELHVDGYYRAQDRTSAWNKMTVASAKYDRNAPGAGSLRPFEAAYLTPMEFRGVVKSAFNLDVNPAELAAIIKEFCDDAGNVPTKPFLVAFMQLGAKEREKTKLVQLEKNRRANKLRREAQARLLREQEAKMVKNVNLTAYTPAEQESSYTKMSTAAKAYDKSMPGCMSLEAFECKTLSAGMFREAIKRTFNLRVSDGELVCLINRFDPQSKGEVNCKLFTTDFVRMGIAMRRKDAVDTLERLREDARLREKEAEEKLAWQWKRMELDISYNFSRAENESAQEKLRLAAEQFTQGGASQMPAFASHEMPPAEFREMLKRIFNLRLTKGELAALIAQFDTQGSGKISCQEFVIKFTQIGVDERRKKTMAQIRKNRELETESKTAAERLQAEKDGKVLYAIDWEFSNEDFNQALEFLRVACAKYDPNHPSAPDLAPFRMGGDMTPAEFKESLRRVFGIELNAKQSGAICRLFDTEGKQRVSPAAFMMHFNKICRLEGNRLRKDKLETARQRVENRREHEQMQERKAKAEEERRLTFLKIDEESVLKKLRIAAQAFAVDSASYLDLLQAYKGPAMLPVAFKEVFRRVFQTKLSFPEVGVLLGIFDETGVGSIDGSKFLKAFFRLGRLEEKIMLGEAPDIVTLDTLRGGGGAASQALSRTEAFNGSSPSRQPRQPVLATATDFNNTRGEKKLRQKQRQKPAAVLSSVAAKYRRGAAQGGGNNPNASAAAAALAQAFTETDTLQDSDNFNRSSLGAQGGGWILPHVASNAAAGEGTEADRRTAEGASSSSSGHRRGGARAEGAGAGNVDPASLFVLDSGGPGRSDSLALDDSDSLARSLSATRATKSPSTLQPSPVQSAVRKKKARKLGKKATTPAAAGVAGNFLFPSLLGAPVVLGAAATVPDFGPV